MEEIDKVIFLDVDGVLNSQDWASFVYKNRYNGDTEMTDMVDPNAVDIICTICSTTGAKVILSSSWRRLTYKDTVENLNKYRDFRKLIPYIVGVTNSYKTRYSRGQEIQYLLNDIRKHHYEHHGVCNIPDLFIDDVKFVSEPKYLIIDDDYDMLDNQMPFFMRTDFFHGITDEQANVIINFFMGNRSEVLTAECNFWHSNHDPSISADHFLKFVK